MKNVDFAISVPPPPVEYRFESSERGGKTRISVENGLGLLGRGPYQQVISVPTDAFAAFARRWLEVYDGSAR
jgi:hypothetical protein